MRRASAESSFIRALRSALHVAFALGLAAACPDLCRAELVYWNVFNIEGESTLSGSIVTYATLADMLTDTNRTGRYDPVGAFGDNLVEGDSDGTTFWNVFNIEGESSLSGSIVTYGTLADMLTDTNRTGRYDPVGAFGDNLVGSGSDGTTYWNVFNIEGESSLSGSIVTYATLGDMLTDTNRTGRYDPVGAFGDNLVGSGATILQRSVPAPEPSTITLCTLGLAGFIGHSRRRRPAQR